MADTPREPQSQDLSVSASDRLKRVREATKGGYVFIPVAAADSRESRRAEREQKAYESHYRDASQGPK